MNLVLKCVCKLFWITRACFNHDMQSVVEVVELFAYAQASTEEMRNNK